jgi:8-oxo-dGTP pyrophosphatase MutT (NUDIX family)
VSAFELVDGHVGYEGKFIRAGVERFRHADGSVVARDKVWHPGAVGVLAIDDEHVWLTRQPREAAALAASLEVPAGKLDVPGEPPLECAQRELAEEIGKRAGHWQEICSFLTSPGFSDERVWLYLASELNDASADAVPDEDERIEVVAWPLGALDQAIAESEDSKTLIALLWLARRSGARRRE